MSDILPPRLVTRVYEELTPSQTLKQAMRAFVDYPGQAMHFSTRAQRSIPTEQYRTHYGQYERAARQRLRRFGRETVALARDVEVYHDEVNLTLLFHVTEEDEPTFTEMTDALNEIEWQPPTTSGLYIQLARTALTEDAAFAAKQLVRQLRQPSAKNLMRVGAPRLMMQDIPISQTALIMPK